MDSVRFFSPLELSPPRIWQLLALRLLTVLWWSLSDHTAAGLLYDADRSLLERRKQPAEAKRQPDHIISDGRQDGRNKRSTACWESSFLFLLQCFFFFTFSLFSFLFSLQFNLYRIETKDIDLKGIVFGEEWIFCVCVTGDGRRVCGKWEFRMSCDAVRSVTLKGR